MMSSCCADFFDEKKYQFRICKETPWKSLVITGVLAFCTIAQFAMFFSSMWPYLQTLDPDSTEPFYGFIVAAYSVGGLLTSPLFSGWSAKTRSVTWPLITCMFSMAIGNLIYTLVPLFSVWMRKYVMLFGRFILGFGDNSLHLLQGYASTASTKADRSKSIAITTCGFGFGLALGPAIQLIFSPIGKDGLQIFEDLRLNMYSAPAVASLFISVGAMLLLKLCFVEEYAGIRKETVDKSENLPKPDKIAVGICYLARYAQFFTFVNLEAIATAFVQTYYGMSKEDTVVFVASTHIGCGFLSLSVYAGFIFFNFDKWQVLRSSQLPCFRINARIAVIMAFFTFGAFYVVTFPWPFFSSTIKTFTESDYQLFVNGTANESPVGCNTDRYSWCEGLALSNQWIYFFGFIILIGLAWPTMIVCLTTILSKVIGPRHQAYYQGIFQNCGSFGRLTAPISMAAIFRTFGPRYVWGFEMAFMPFLALLVGIFYQRLIPLEEAHAKRAVKHDFDSDYVAKE